MSSVRFLRQFLLHLVRFRDQVARIVVHFQNPDGVAGGEGTRVQLVVEDQLPVDHLLAEVVQFVAVAVEQLRQLDVVRRYQHDVRAKESWGSPSW